MIPHGVEVFVALETIDLRWSFDRLTVSALLSGRLGREVRGGALFVFFGRRHDAVKILFVS
jgi:transposase